MVERKFKAIVLDLFDTLVKWDPTRLPTMKWREREVHSTIPWLVPKLREAMNGQLELDTFLTAYQAVMEEISVERKRDGIEITCRERFARTLKRLEVTTTSAALLAEELTRVHM